MSPFCLEMHVTYMYGLISALGKGNVSTRNKYNATRYTFYFQWERIVMSFRNKNCNAIWDKVLYQ